MRTISRLTLAGAVVALLGLAAVAPADQRLRPDANHTPGRMDIREATAGHSTDGRLRHTVATFGKWTPIDLVSKQGPPGSVCIQIWTRRKPSSQPGDYLVCANADRKGRDLRGLVSRISRRPGRTGKTSVAAVSRVNNRELVLRFAASQIGNPDRYYWRAETVYHAMSCPEPTGCLDTAPDLPRASTHVLKKQPQATTPTPRAPPQK